MVDAGRATFQKNSPILAIAWAPGAKVQAKKVTGLRIRYAIFQTDVIV